MNTTAAPTVRTVTGPDEYPVGRWYRRPQDSCEFATIYELGFWEYLNDHGMSAEVYDDEWLVFDEDGYTAARGNEGNFTANLIAADAALDAHGWVSGPRALL